MLMLRDASAQLQEEVQHLGKSSIKLLLACNTMPLGGKQLTYGCDFCVASVSQVQYNYVALEEIFRDSSTQPLWSLVALLLAKVAATSVRPSWEQHSSKRSALQQPKRSRCAPVSHSHARCSLDHYSCMCMPCLCSLAAGVRWRWASGWPVCPLPVLGGTRR